MHSWYYIFLLIWKNIFQKYNNIIFFWKGPRRNRWGPLFSRRILLMSLFLYCCALFSAWKSSSWGALSCCLLELPEQGRRSTWLYRPFSAARWQPDERGFVRPPDQIFAEPPEYSAPGDIPGRWPSSWGVFSLLPQAWRSGRRYCVLLR